MWARAHRLVHNCPTNGLIVWRHDEGGGPTRGSFEGVGNPTQSERRDHLMFFNSVDAATVRAYAEMVSEKLKETTTDEEN